MGKAERLAKSTPPPTNSRAATYRNTVRFARQLANGRAIVEFETGDKKNRTFHQTMGNFAENGYLILAGIEVRFRDPQTYHPNQIPILAHPHCVQRMVQTLGTSGMVQICRIWSFHASSFAINRLSDKSDGDTIITASEKLMMFWRPSEKYAHEQAWEAITVIDADKLDGKNPTIYA